MNALSPLSLPGSRKNRRNSNSRGAGKHQRRRFLSLENLEGRSLLAMLVADVVRGTSNTGVSGTVYEDVNSNGVRDGGENGVAGWTVYLDLDNSGTLNNDAAGTPEPSAVTNRDGSYSINRLVPNTYRVGEVMQTGWTATAPVSQDVIVTAGRSTKADFFNFSGGDIAGTVWNDLNQDSVRATDPVSGSFTDPGLAGWTVFLDLNNDRLPGADEPATITAADGSYSFVGLPPGDYEVTEVLPTGWDVPSRFDIRQTAAVVARQQAVQDFANFSLTNGSIQGVIWNDTNANGIRETDPTTGEFSEPGLADWTVFLDTNKNAILDAGERSTLTDANGNYAFISLDAGDYEVTEVLPVGWDVSPAFDSRQTVAVTGGEVSTSGDFANFTVQNGSIRGAVWNDLNRDGLRDVNTLTGAYLDPGLTNWTIYLDLNRNRLADPGEPTTLTDVNGNYAFVDLQVGEYQVIEVLPTGWEASTTFSDNQSVVVYSGAESVAPDFANYNVAVSTPGSVSGVVWNDLNANGVRDVGDLGLAGWTVFVDVNSDRLLNAGEPQATSATDGSYTLTGVLPGSVSIVVQPTAGWRATAPLTSSRTIALRSGDTASGLDFGETEIKDSSIRGTVFADTNRNQVRDAGEQGLGGITVYLDLNNNSTLDVGEPQAETSGDLFYTPGIDEAGTYSFTHLASGTYTVRQVVPATLSATPESQRSHAATITAAVGQNGVDFADVYRANEIHGVKFDDANSNHMRDAGEAGVAGATIYIDLDRDNVQDAGEPSTVTLADGSYSFTNLSPGAYVVREVASAGYSQTSPTTVGGILWPAGVSNPAVGNLSPTSITTSLAAGGSYRQSVSLTLPNTGALTNLVDVFLLFDDTGSFVNNSPIVRAAFPNIISQLQTSLPGIDLGFGVGRLEEYANFAWEYDSGRPFILNQPIVAASSAGYLAAIQAALNRTTPGYGGDQPETDIEALYQLVTGRGFDGNNNGSVLDSGPAGFASTQLNPGSSGDVPSFASFVADPANNVMPAAGSIGGAGFRAGALPIILLATDTGFAYQPQGETTVTGAGGVTVPVSSLTETSRPTTPFNYGAGLQQTITGLNALGALVIGLGTNTEATLDPRQGLEAISKLTGATNQSTATIANGTADPIAPGDPFYFQIASGFGASVANGVTSAIQNAVTNVAVDVEVQASDPRVHIINHTGTLRNVGAGSTATFDVEFVGDGIPHRFDLQFVRAGTNVVLGSIPVVIGTPVPGNGYEFDDLQPGEIEVEDNFGSVASSVEVVNAAPSFNAGGSVSVAEDAGAQSIAAWATAISAGSASEAGQVVNFVVSNNSPSLFSVQPTISADGTLSFTTAANAFGTATVTVQLHDNGGTANGGADTSAAQSFTINVTSVNDAPAAAADAYSTAENASLSIAASGVLGNDMDVEGDALAAVLVSGPSHGTLALNANGSFVYTPSINYNGLDSFTYKANDGIADSKIATVSLVVTPVSYAPVAVADSYTTAEDTNLIVIGNGVLANDTDTDADADLLSARLVSGPSHGTLVFNPNGSFSYSPNANYNGPDSFTYRANDGTLDSAIATVNLTVAAVNDAPTANSESYSTAEGTILTVMPGGVLSNDVDVDGDPLRATLVSGPSHGSLTLNADGSFIYNPLAYYNGPDSFTYRANDGSADSNAVTVNITVTPVNDPPVATLDSYQTNQGAVLSVTATNGVLANDRDVDGDVLSAAVVTTTTNGMLVLNTNGSFTYTPQAGFAGIDSFTYLASDGLLSSNLVTVTIDVKLTPPTSGTKFIVVDATADQTFNYDAAGNLVVRHSLNKEAQESRGVTANKDGSVYWVVDKDGKVYVHDQSGRLLGTWEATGIDKPEGIATNGKDLWIVDRETDRVFFFAGAAARRTGTMNPTSSFALAAGNRDPYDVTTDGTRLWVVNDTSSVDKVFRYSLTGTLQGSWQIDSANRNPTGLTIDPNDVNHVWIVDATTDRVYEYSGATNRLAGQQSAARSFALNTADGNPQGIADPRQAPRSAIVDEETLAAVATAHHAPANDVWTAALQAVIAGQKRPLHSTSGGIMQTATKPFRYRGR